MHDEKPQHEPNPSPGESPVGEPAIEEPSDGVPVEEPPADPPPVDEPPSDESPVQEPPVEKPPFDEPPTNGPSAEGPADGPAAGEDSPFFAAAEDGESLPDEVAAIHDSLSGAPAEMDAFSAGETAVLSMQDAFFSAPKDDAAAPVEIQQTGDDQQQPVPAPDDVEMGPDRRSLVWIWVGVIVGVLLVSGAAGYAWWYSTSRPIVVPDIVGKLPAQAVQTLNDADLRLGKVTEEPTETVPAGTIIEQKPAAKTSLKPNAQVSFVLAASPDGAKVPVVSGRSVAEAERELARARLTAYRVESFSATAAAGVVIHQLPAAGTNVEPGEPIALAVSQGPAPSQVRLPRLAGLSEADASALLKVVGLQGIAYRSYNSSVGAGEIVTQTPAPKMQLPFDSAVQFWVSQGPGSASITIPNVNGLARKEAQKRLKSRGLNVEVRTIASTTVPKGKVISQMPPSGARAATGGTVGLLVSNGNVSNGSTPDLLGKSLLEAEGIVKEAGFSPVLIEVATPEHPAGQVFGQFPESNTLWPLRSPLVGVVAKSP